MHALPENPKTSLDQMASLACQMKEPADYYNDKAAAMAATTPPPPPSQGA